MSGEFRFDPLRESLAASEVIELRDKIKESGDPDSTVLDHIILKIGAPDTPDAPALSDDEMDVMFSLFAARRRDAFVLWEVFTGQHAESGSPVGYFLERLFVAGWECKADFDARAARGAGS